MISMVFEPYARIKTYSHSHIFGFFLPKKGPDPDLDPDQRQTKTQSPGRIRNTKDHLRNKNLQKLKSREKLREF
jgi:hypothetical protein